MTARPSPPAPASRYNLAMRFPPSFIEEIKARLPVSEVVARRVKLQKAGREFKGLSPFNAEKTPSFFVNDQKQAWFDFSSGKNGSIFDFVMLTEGASFPEAVEKLAGMAGLPLPSVTPEMEQREKRRATLHEALDLAARYFQEQLQGREGAKARGYLQDRAISPALQREFRMGYAPNEKFALRDWLAGKDVPSEIMIEAGLLIHGPEIAVPYDRFRDRVMFPIEDARGRVVAFGGRALEKDVPAKYLNSPETPLFHKGALLYNHHRARKAAQDRGTVIAVEGYVDVIALTGAGVPHAVAPLGTALTPDQCGLLWRMAEEPILCFDGDRAGRKAAFRAIETALPLLGAGRSFRFALLPEGQDPDDLVRAGGPAAVEEALAAARPLVEMLWTREVEAVGALDTPERRAALERRLTDEALQPIADATLRGHYRDEMRRRLDALFVRAGAPAQRGRPGERRPPARREPPRGRGRPFAAEPRYGYVEAPLAVGPGLAESLTRRAAPARESVIVAALMNHPDLVARHAEELAGLSFQGRDTARLLAALLALGHEETDADALRAGLDAAGLAEERRRLEAQAALDPLWSIRPDADPSDAWQVLRQALRQQQEVDLRKSLKLAEKALADEPSEKNQAILGQLHADLASMEGREATIEGFGAASGRGSDGV